MGSVVKKFLGNFKVSDVNSMRNVKVLYSNGLISTKYKALKSNLSRPCSITSKQRKAFQIMKGVQTRGEPASRLQAIDRKAKVSEGVGQLLGGAHTRTGKKRGILEWPKTFRPDSARTCESFASNRSQTESVKRFLAHFWAERMRRLEKPCGFLKWPKTFCTDSGRTCESFASVRLQTETV